MNLPGLIILWLAAALALAFSVGRFIALGSDVDRPQPVRVKTRQPLRVIDSDRR
jgi:hypothetical protein